MTRQESRRNAGFVTMGGEGLEHCGGREERLSWEVRWMQRVVAFFAARLL